MELGFWLFCCAVLGGLSETCAVYGPVLPAQDAGRAPSQMGYVVEECEGRFFWSRVVW